MQIDIIGVPIDLGADRRGVDMGPSAIRYAHLHQKLQELGYTLHDEGNIEAPIQETCNITDPKLKYIECIIPMARRVAGAVATSLQGGCFPLVIGGDHSLSAGSIRGAAKHKKLGVIWVDAHADFNTPETTPSGNIHGMPLAALLGYGAPELVNLEGFAPKLDPKLCAHVGAREIDPGERELIRELGVRFFTMREIDERGLAVCIDEAIHIVQQATAGYGVTFDIDALDPGDAPGSGTLVRGGLTYREAHLAMEKIAEAGGMRALEVVEINTALDVNNKTAELGVELILSALGKTIL